MCGILLLPAAIYDVGDTTAPGWRGPNLTTVTKLVLGGVPYVLVFSRLEVVAASSQSQPFVYPLGRPAGYACAVNGEIYNYRQMHRLIADTARAAESEPAALAETALLQGLLTEGVPLNFCRGQASRMLRADDADDGRDCAVVAKALPLFGARRTLELLHGEFATVAAMLDTVLLARDTYGVRPLYYGRIRGSGLLVAASSPQCFGPCAAACPDLRQVPPGGALVYSAVSRTFIETFSFTPDAARLLPVSSDEVGGRAGRAFLEACRCRCEQQDGSYKTLVMLSGGMDSSIVCAVAVALLGRGRVEAVTAHYNNPRTADVVSAAAICSGLGICHHVVDLAGPAAEFEGHVVAAVHALGTWDTTTVRAGTAQYVMLDKLQRALQTPLHTRYRVVLGGEGADELAGGYQYFRAAPSAEDAYEEAARLLRSIHFYDGLRADRTTAAFGLELRLPFLDVAFTAAYTALPDRHAPEVEKKRLRDLMLDHVLPTLDLPAAAIDAVQAAVMRAKEALSDSVGLGWTAALQRLAQQRVHPGALDVRAAAAAPAADVRAPVTAAPRPRRTVYMDGVFDLFHVGHLQAIQQCVELGDRVLIGVTDDETATGYKRRPIIHGAHRAAIVAALEGVDKVVYPCPLHLTEAFMEANDIDLVVHGFANSADAARQHGFFATVQAAGRFKKIAYSTLTSTTDILHRICTRPAPATLEQLYYRVLFETRYPHFAHQIPAYWMPRWVGASDPSATTLPCYSGEFSSQ